MRLSVLLCSLLIPAVAMVSGCSKSDKLKDSATTSTTTTTSTNTSSGADSKPAGQHKVMVSPISESSFTPAQQQYCIDLQNRLTEGWRPLKNDRRYSVAVVFTITRPGLCTDVHTVSATGGQRAIERTVDSVKMLSPFAPLPADFVDAPAQFRCDFLYYPDSNKSAK